MQKNKPRDIIRTMEYLQSLNEEQLAAVEHSGSPLLILAGAGSGKTRVITTKIAYLISEKKIKASSILAVTFTKKAAAEMMQRARELEPLASHSQIRTFHSFGAWFLRLHHQEAGVDPNFTVYDDDDSAQLLKKAVPSLSTQDAKYMAHKIARAKDYCYGPESENLCEIEEDLEFPRYYAAYERRLRETGNVDFGDLIQLPVILLQNNEGIRNFIHRLFKVVMVDEYQDSNVAQFQLLQQLVGPETYVCVVGDDDQSIYKFRGAEVQNILNFQKEFPGTELIKLEQNYRSRSGILKLADGAIKNNEDRLGKTLRAVRGMGKRPVVVFLATQDDEVRYCAKLITEAKHKGVPYNNWAILYRTNAQSMGFETEFLKQKIPYNVVGSLKFYEREEVKDILSYLSFLVNPRDEIAFRRVVNKPARAIGSITQDKIINLSKERLLGTEAIHQNIYEACQQFLTQASKKAKEGLETFLSIIETGKNLLEESIDEKQTLSVLIEKIITISGLDAYHAAQDEISGSTKLANLQELINSALPYQKTTEGLVAFLEHIDLDRALMQELQEGEDRDAVTLITLHNTKGLEFERVIITGMEEGLFPRSDKTDEELEEERRLFYVGITRAKDELYFTNCVVRRVWGYKQYLPVSPLLLEIAHLDLEIQGKPPHLFSLARNTAFNASKKMLSKNSSSDESFDNFFLEEEQKTVLAEDKKTDSKGWSRGQKIFHDDFGYGAIFDVKETSGEITISIQFENGQIKKILPKYAGHKIMAVKD